MVVRISMLFSCNPIIYCCIQMHVPFQQIHFFAVISINQVNVNNSTFMWALISRRSVYRAGARLSCRGIDKDVSVN